MAWVRIPALLSITRGASEEVFPPCCASLLLSVKWVAVKIKYVNLCRGLKDFDVSVLCKEGFAVNIIPSPMLMASSGPSAPSAGLTGFVFL